MAVGAVELGEVRQHAAVGDGRSRRVGLLEGALDPAVEHRLVPARELLAHEPPDPAGSRVALQLRGVGDRLVVGAPLHDRGMVTDGVDGLARLVDGAVPNAAAVAPLQREVLEQQHTELVGGVVQGVGRDVRLDAQAVEARFDGELDIAADVGGRGVGEAGARGHDVGALDEDPLAVDRQHPVRPGHLAQPGAARRRVAHLVVDHHVDADLGQWLVAQRSRPPQPGLGEVERPVDLVAALGEGVLGLADHLAVARGAQQHRTGVGRVEAGVQAQVGAGLVGIPAQHAEPVDAHRTGVVDADGAPQAAGVPVPVDRLGVLEQPGDVVPAGRAPLGSAGQLDGEEVLVGQTAERGDVEAVREEVPLGVAEVGAVEPHVGLVEEAVERDPAPLPGPGERGVEASAVHERTIARRERRLRSPMPGHGDVVPVRVVEVEP